MKKVKITQEQAKRIDEIKKEYGIDHFISDHSKGWTFPENVCLNQLTISELARALYVGYEVEPEFKAGDWIVYTPFNQVRVISGLTKDKQGTFADLDYDLIQGVSVEFIRHATPEEIATEKERRFFDENGRKPWELRGYDLLMSPGVVKAFEVDRVVGEKVFMSNHAYENLENIKRNYRVACFAEDRKDI